LYSGKYTKKKDLNRCYSILFDTNKHELIQMKKGICVSLDNQTISLLNQAAALDQRDKSSLVSKAVVDYAAKLGLKNDN
jgi:uncharacterized protein (DUF1778 family)